MTQGNADPLDHVWHKQDVADDDSSSMDALHLSLRGCFQGDAESDAWIDDIGPQDLDVRLPRDAFAADALIPVPIAAQGWDPLPVEPIDAEEIAARRAAEREQRQEKERDREREKDRESRRHHKHRHKDKERDKDRGRDRDKDRDRKDHEKDKERDTRRKIDALESGTVIDKYRIDGVLGAGGFAVVYRATHMLLRIPVALKLLKAELVQKKPHVADLLCEEARYMAQLNHPNVARVFDVTRNDTLAYIVMEFIEGKSLSETIRTNAPLDPSIVIRIGIDVCNGLKAALERTVIHRDIKPANIIITDDFTAKIVDLGLARPALMDLSTAKTDKGHSHVSGTPAYMSPEQSRTPDAIDFRSDIYSLGVTLYHASTGTLPFKAKDHKEYYHLHQTEPIPRPETRLSSFPPELSDVIMKMVEKEPERRPQSYDELLGMLRAALAAVSR